MKGGKAASPSSASSSALSRNMDVEDVMLDELEFSTKRIFHQSKALNEEAITHVRILNKVEKEMSATSSGLRDEALRAELARKSKGGICWMYVVIFLEAFLLVTLCMYGLS